MKMKWAEPQKAAPKRHTLSQLEEITEMQCPGAVNMEPRRHPRQKSKQKYGVQAP